MPAEQKKRGRDGEHLAIHIRSPLLQSATALTGLAKTHHCIYKTFIKRSSQRHLFQVA